MGPNQTYKALESKGKHKTRREPVGWEEIFVNDATDEGWISQISKNKNHITQYQEKQCNKKKWAKDLNSYFFKDDRWPTGKGKDNQDHQLLEKCKSKLQWGTTLHWSEWLSFWGLQIVHGGNIVEKREPSYTIGGNVNCWKIVWRFLRKLRVAI